MDLVTKLTDRVEVLENDMQQTKKVYSYALTKLILKLEKKVKTNKSRRRASIVISEDEDAEEDYSKQRRKISEINKDPTILLVQPKQDMEYDFDVRTRSWDSELVMNGWLRLEARGASKGLEASFLAYKRSLSLTGSESSF
ncbi:hypothetical protein Tco_0017866 [Tanacetum coccineum]